MHQVAGVSGVPARAEPEGDLARLAVGQFEWNLDCGTGIQGGSHLAGKPRAGHCGRVSGCAVAPDEFRAIAADGSDSIVHVKERNPAGELRVVAVTRVDRAVAGVDFGDYVH